MQTECWARIGTWPRSPGPRFGSGTALARAQREVASYKRFRGLVQEVVEGNERVCEARPVGPLATDQCSGEGKQGQGSSSSSKPTGQPR